MKKFTIVLISFLLIGFVLAGCSNPAGGNGGGTGGEGGGGLLTIKGTLPGTGTVNFAQVFTNPSAPIVYVDDFLQAVNPDNYKIMSSNSSSPFVLKDIITGKVFSESGTFMVIIMRGADEWYKTDVSFTNGSAEVLASDLKNGIGLPLTPAVTP